MHVDLVVKSPTREGKEGYRYIYVYASVDVCMYVCMCVCMHYSADDLCPLFLFSLQ